MKLYMKSDVIISWLLLNGFFPVETPRWTFRMLLFVTNSKELKPEPKRIDLFTFLHRWHL